MNVGGYNLQLSENRLDEILTTQTRDIELIDRDFQPYRDLSEGDRKALDHLVAAARLINDVALEQDHPLNLSLKAALEQASAETPYAQKALCLFRSLNGVAGYNGIDKEPIELFESVHYLKGKNFYPEDLSVQEFYEILLRMAERGKIDQIKQILSARTMVRRQDDELVAVDYTVWFEKSFSKIANELEVAAHYCTDELFKDYLGWQAQALLQNNPEMDVLADRHWARLQNCPLEWTLSRENYEDEMTGTIYDSPAVTEMLTHFGITAVAKDTLGCRVGLLNREGTDRILRSKETLPHLAAKMPFCDSYKQSVGHNTDVRQTMADVDLLVLTGDYAMCRGGITTAQNLPNNDKPSVQSGGGRRNVYHRQIMLSRDLERIKRLMDELLAPELHAFYDQSQSLAFVIGHENGHTLGPDSTYQNALGVYKHIIEEHKADVISVAFMPELKRTFAAYADIDLKRFYTTWVVRDLFLRARPILSKPHRMAELIQFNYLLTHQALWFDKQGKLHIRFELMERVLYDLLTDTIRVQLSASAEEARRFVERWTTWTDQSQAVADTQKRIGMKPYIRLVEHF
jgi:hypothetical protein